MTDVKGWVIALLGSRNLVGCPSRSLDEEPITKGSVRLNPVYEIAMQSVAGAKGPATFRTIRPVLLFGEVSEITIPKDVPVLLIDRLSAASQTDLARAIAAAEDIAAGLRSGLVTS